MKTDWLISKQKGHLFYFSSSMGGPYISSGSLEELPPPPLWAAHSGCHYQAGVNGLQLMSSTTSTALSYCHWLPATEHWHQSTEGMAKKKNYKFVLERIRKRECGCCSLGSRGTGWLSVPSDSAAHMPEHLPLHAPSVQLQSKINK